MKLWKLIEELELDPETGTMQGKGRPNVVADPKTGMVTKSYSAGKVGEERLKPIWKKGIAAFIEKTAYRLMDFFSKSGISIIKTPEHVSAQYNPRKSSQLQTSWDVRPDEQIKYKNRTDTMRVKSYVIAMYNQLIGDPDSHGENTVYSKKKQYPIDFGRAFQRYQEYWNYGNNRVASFVWGLPMAKNFVKNKNKTRRTILIFMRKYNIMISYFKKFVEISKSPEINSIIKQEINNAKVEISKATGGKKINEEYFQKLEKGMIDILSYNRSQLIEEATGSIKRLKQYLEKNKDDGNILINYEWNTNDVYATITNISYKSREEEQKKGLVGSIKNRFNKPIEWQNIKS